MCPNCGHSLKEGMFSGNFMLRDDTVRAIGLALDVEASARCQKCVEPASDVNEALSRKISTLQNSVARKLPLIPVVSIHSPLGWDYKCLGVVTAQSTTGTGLWSDVTSAFTDLFGAQSKVYNSKIRDGEDLCLAALRMQALKLGGNAVIAVDIDYAEVGGQRAMLMVCMTGTAVHLSNAEMVSDDLRSVTLEVADHLKDLEALERAHKQVNTAYY